MKKMVLIALTILFAAAGYAQEIPKIEFKGLAPDEDASEIIKGLDWQCSPTQTGGSDTGCINHKETIAGVRTESVSVFLKDKHVTTILISFSEKDFDRVTAALGEKFGKPTKEENKAVQNRLGASFENAIKTWKNGDTVMVAMQRAGSLDKSRITIDGKLFIDLARKEIEAQKKQEAKDL